MKKSTSINLLLIAISAFLILAAPARAGLMDNIKQKAKDTATSPKQSQPADSQASSPQQSTPQQTSRGSQTQSQEFTLGPDMSAQEVAQVWLDAVYAGDMPKAKAASGGTGMGVASGKMRSDAAQDVFKTKAKEWELAQEWGDKPMKHTIDRVENDFDMTHVHCRAVAGIEPKITLGKLKGAWRVMHGSSLSFGIALLDDEKKWKEGSPAKVARTWFDAMIAEDWEKVSSVERGGSRSANLLRDMREARKAGKKILPVSIDYLQFNYLSDYSTPVSAVQVHCSSGGEKYFLELWLREGVWLVERTSGQPGKWGWPTKEFWEGVKLQGGGGR